MTQPSLEAAIDRLHAVPLEEFVGERTRLSRELRKGGDRGAAAEIAKRPKPSAAAWALNHVAREEPDSVREWLEAASALRDASARAGKGGGDALRLAMGEHRTATSRLVAVARDRLQPSGRPLSEAMLDRVRTLLQAATIDAQLADDLERGRIDEERQTGSEPEREGDAVEVQPTKRGRKPKPASKAGSAHKASPKEKREAAARAERRAELERRVAAASEELERLRHEADGRRAAAKSADERFDEADRTVRRMESEAAAAREAAKDAVGAVTGAEGELSRLRALL